MTPAVEVGAATLPPAHPAVSYLTHLLLHGANRDGHPVRLDDLAARVANAWQLWMAAPTRYTLMSSLLPELTAEVEQAVRQSRTPQEESQRRRVNEIAAHHYFLLRSFFRAVRRYDLATLIADRAILSAEAADDPILIAAARWNLATVLLINNSSDIGEEVATEAARALMPLMSDSSLATAMYGALHLTAASAAARNRGKASNAHDYLYKHARPAAQKTGETNALWTAFGPMNVYVIGVGLEMAMGNRSEALRLADLVDTRRLGSIERRATYLLEVAQCYEQHGEDTGVLHYLMRAEREAPEDLRYHPLSAPLIRNLLSRSRPGLRPEIQALARKAGVDE